MLDNNCGYSIDFTIQDLIDLRAHLGHRVGALNPKMRDYVFGVKNDVSIIDVRKTYMAALEAIEVCYKFSRMNKKILFVGTMPQISGIVKEYAEKCSQYYVTDRWLGGILTNWYTVSKSIKTLISYEKVFNSEDSGLSKKELLAMRKNYDKLMASFGGLINLRGRPDLVIIFNTKVDYLAVKEALSIGIPTIAILDTNVGISGVDYPIVANDSNIGVIKFFCSEFAKAIIKGASDNMKESGFDVSSILNKKNDKQASVNVESVTDLKEKNVNQVDGAGVISDDYDSNGTDTNDEIDVTDGDSKEDDSLKRKTSNGRNPSKSKKASGKNNNLGDSE